MKAYAAYIRSLIGTLTVAGITLTTARAVDLFIPQTMPTESLAIQPNGQFLADVAALTRFNEDGTVDTTFEPLGRASMIAIENEGTILAHPSSGVHRFSFDASPLPAPAVRFRKFVLQADGKLVGVDSTTLRRVHPDGSPDASFTNAPVQLRGGLALQEDGKIILGETLSGAILRFNADGSPDPTFNASVFNSTLRISHIVVQADGKILLAGRSFAIADAQRNGVARLNRDGSLDSGFNPGFAFGTIIDSVALQANGKIIVGGASTLSQGNPRRISRA